MTIAGPEELHLVHDIIHDCFFDVDDIRFDSEQSTLTFRFRRPISSDRIKLKDFVYTSKSRPTVECFLTIYNVKSYSISDTENVGTYDFNVLDFDPLKHCLTIGTNVPIDIKLEVRDFRISVEQTDNLLESGKGTPDVAPH